MHNLHIVAQGIVEYVPTCFYVFHEGLCLVLGQDDDFVDIGINAVAKGNIYDSIYTPKWNRGL
jgi:hypothetical protein